MNLQRFWQMIWVRKFLVLGVTAAVLLGAAIVILVVPPQWQARTDVLLGVLKPDPITGLVPPNATTRAYISTQVELATDFTVVDKALSDLGLYSDPNVQTEYANRSRNDQRDIHHWLAQATMARIKAKVLEDSNVMELSYVGNSAENARQIADAVRRAYIEQSAELHRADALRDARFFDNEVTQAKTELDQAQDALAEFERKNGIVMQDDKVDVDTARLRALAMQSGGAVVGQQIAQTGSAAMELSAIDAQISQAEKTLGPNHPDMVALRARRAALEVLAHQEDRAAASSARASSGQATLDQEVQAQKSRVLQETGKVGQLQQLSTEVDQKKDNLTRALSRLADARQQAEVDQTGITPLGAAITPQHPSFPNIPLILGGALIGGLSIGVAVSILLELLMRRVRGPEDLQGLSGAPLLAVIQGADKRAARGQAPLRNRPQAVAGGATG